MENLELLHVEDGENPSGFGAVDSRVEAMGTEDREIWLERQQNHLLDINDHDASFFYCEFPPLPDFPCMSSSSSSSSAPVTVKEIACSSSASSASSSSSAASWAVLRLDAVDDKEKRKNNSHHDQQHYSVDASTAALSSNGLMEMSQPLDDSMDGVDCMDVMENFGYMDLLDSNDLFDPSNIFHHDESPLEEFQQEQKPQQEQTRGPQEVLEHEEQMIMLQRKNNDETRADGASEDLAMVFLEWLKTNKETVSAEDLRRVKIKKATIECAAKRLGGGKEGMKQLLKLILEWVQANHLQKRRIKESPSIDNNSLPYQYQPDSFQNHNPNPSTDPFPPPPDSNPCFSQPPWIAQPAYVPEPASVVQGFAPPVAGYMDHFSNAAHLPPCQRPTEYHMLDSAQTWPPSQFALASEYNKFPDNNLQPPPPPSQPVLIGYGHHYPYQYIPGHNDQRTLVRLGSSATKEARKKRMARQRRFSTHNRNHSHHHNQQSQHQNHSAIQHARLGNDNCTPAAQGNTAGSWVYWPTAAGRVGSAPPALPADASVGPPQTSHHRQSASDRRQGWKSEKNLRFLLQKVLKQSDVGSLGRIVLPKKEAETHLPGLEARDGIPIAMEDIGTSRVWNMRYRFWPNNKSRMYLLENTGDFVRTNGLQEGDFIVLYSDVRCGKYLIRGVKVRQPGTGGAKLETNRPGKSQKNQHANSPSSAAVNGSSPSQKQ